MEKEIEEQFEELGIEVSNEILGKCTELCTIYNVSPNDFVIQWMAFSLSNLGGSEPTVQYLCDMERKELLNKKEKMHSSSAKSGKARFSDASQLAIYGVSMSSTNEDINGVEDDIMDSYVCRTPKAPKTALARTPARQNDALFSPVSYSPITGTPKTQLGNSGKIVYTFGNQTLMKHASWTSTRQEKIILKQIAHENEVMNSRSKYMFDSLLEKSMISGDRLFSIGKEICKKVFGEKSLDYDLEEVDEPSKEPIKTMGMICCDFDGKLDPASTILVGADDMRCRTVRLNFSKTKSFGIFPGQTVMVSGVNPKGEVIFVEEVISERILTPPTSPKISNELRFVVASGPYTHNDDLVYDPLHYLILYCKDNKPDVLIMTGPFMEADHSLVIGNVLAESFESFFEKMLGGIVEAIGEETTICMISSYKDAVSCMVYPTHPMTTKKAYPNVHMLPDPCLIDVNGVIIGITSTDVVDHLLTEELSVNAGDKVKRVVNYLLHQGSFYPLNPPPLDMCLDSSLANKFARLDTVPNIMILPSAQKNFIRDVNGCLAINPGNLTDKSGGTFARFIVYPSKEESTPFNYMACQIMKV